MESDNMSPSAISVVVARTPEEVEKLRTLYELTQWHPEADIDYFLTSLGTADNSPRPHVVALFDAGKPCAMMVGRIEHTRPRWRIGYKSFAGSPIRLLTVIYGGVLGDQSTERMTALCHELFRSLAEGEADVAMFRHIRMDSALFRIAITVPGFMFSDHAIIPSRHWKLALPRTFAEFLKSRSENTRTYIKRYANRFKKKYGERYRIECLHSERNIDAVMNHVEQVAAKTYHRSLGAGFHHTPLTRARWLLAARRQWLRVYLLYVDGEPCAYWSGFLYRNIYYIEHTAFDPQYREDRTGMFLLLHIIEQFCFSGEASAIDYGFGDADYKKRLGSECWDEAEVYLFAPNLRGFYLSMKRGLTTGLHKAAKHVLHRLGIVDWVKTRWRKKLSAGEQRE